MRNTNDEVCERTIVCIFRLDNQFDIWCGRRSEDEYVWVRRKIHAFLQEPFGYDKQPQAWQ